MPEELLKKPPMCDFWLRYEATTTSPSLLQSLKVALVQQARDNQTKPSPSKMTSKHFWAVPQACANISTSRGETGRGNAAGNQAAFSATAPASGILWELLAITETSVALEARVPDTAAEQSFRTKETASAVDAIVDFRVASSAARPAESHVAADTVDDFPYEPTA
jgi:hypothetical protein